MMKILVLMLCFLLLASCSREGFEGNKEEQDSSLVSYSENMEKEDVPIVFDDPEKEEEEKASSDTGEEIIDESKEEEKNDEALFSRDDWRLILVNRENLIPDDFKVALSSTHGYLMDSRITGFYDDMYNAAKADGIDLLLCYGYRTKEQSEALFQKQINRQMASGLDYETAVEEAKKWVAPPGTSEHHTGLALDIVTPSYQMLTHDFMNTDAAKWMKDNAYKYGFILRYPEDKEDITGITFEPWHYRYVGEEAAKYIYDNSLCLEEFLKGDNVN